MYAFAENVAVFDDLLGNSAEGGGLKACLGKVSDIRGHFDRNILHFKGNTVGKGLRHFNLKGVCSVGISRFLFRRELGLDAVVYEPDVIVLIHEFYGVVEEIKCICTVGVYSGE